MEKYRKAIRSIQELYEYALDHYDEADEKAYGGFRAFEHHWAVICDARIQGVIEVAMTDRSISNEEFSSINTYKIKRREGNA